MTQEALKLALEALEEAWYHVGTFQPTEKAIDLYDEARAAIKEALAQPEQEPVQEPYKGLSEHMMQATNGRVRIDPVTGNTGIGTPPQRSESSGKPSAWVGLTNEELTDLFYNTNLGQQSAVSQAIALLKEKNS